MYDSIKQQFLDASNNYTTKEHNDKDGIKSIYFRDPAGLRM